jgi:nicotinamidase/pyrazinamidase
MPLDTLTQARQTWYDIKKPPTSRAKVAERPKRTVLTKGEKAVRPWGRRMMMACEALIIVDVQNDFCPGGALAVPNGDQVIGAIESWVATRSSDLIVVTTQDAHPPDHVSFHARGGPWPSHCVVGTWGFERHPALRIVPNAQFYKGFNRDVDAYSGFEGRLGSSPSMAATNTVSLADFLRQQDAVDLYVAGLATDYCVKATVLDALALGFPTTVLLGGVRGVDVHPGDSQAALDEMARRGARFL